MQKIMAATMFGSVCAQLSQSQQQRLQALAVDSLGSKSAETIVQAGQVLTYLDAMTSSLQQQGCKQYKHLGFGDDLSLQDTYFQAELVRLFDCKHL